MALIQLEVGVAETMDEMRPADEAIKLYTLYLGKAKELMMNKNHDYGEAWRKMRISSLTDIMSTHCLYILIQAVITSTSKAIRLSKTLKSLTWPAVV